MTFRKMIEVVNVLKMMVMTLEIIQVMVIMWLMELVRRIGVAKLEEVVVSGKVVVIEVVIMMEFQGTSN